MFATLQVSSPYKTAAFVSKEIQHKKRFPFWKVFWVILAINLGLAILSLIVVSIVPDLFRRDVYFKASFWKNQVFSIAFHILFYYFTLNSYYKLIAEKKGLIHYLPVTILAMIACIAFLEADYYLFPSGLSTNKVARTSVIVFSYLVSTLFFIGLSLLIAYFVSLRDEKKQRKLLEAQKLQLEIEKSHANLNFLKAQINPHFLHNTLNFLYAKSLPYSPELSEGILTLSDIMRYALSEGNFKDGKAPLKDEIEHLRNVIRIHQLRYNNSLHVNFEVNGVINGATIIPFVLITIAENAFKHGDLKSTEYPIDIKLTVDHSSLQFYCRNKKKAGPKELSTGIGLDNIKKRLDLAYKDQYMLHIKDEHELYTTQLTIHTL